MILPTIIKLKTLGLATQVVTGAFINGALIGGAVVAGAVIASQARSGEGLLCNMSKDASPTEQ